MQNCGWTDGLIMMSKKYFASVLKGLSLNGLAGVNYNAVIISLINIK